MEGLFSGGFNVYVFRHSGSKVYCFSFLNVFLDQQFVLTFFLDKKSNKKVKPIPCLTASRRQGRESSLMQVFLCELAGGKSFSLELFVGNAACYCKFPERSLFRL